jgi:D-alanyl-D-alanine carboxypeptidase/D-alanyl-D-alanine-endopeptidase (penicillin-binding protein 4)
VRTPLIAIAAATVVLGGCSGDPAPESSTGVGSIPGLSQAAVDIMNSAPYAGSTWAVKVADADTGEVLVDYNTTALLEPASVTKTFSVGAAWLKFGPDYTISTPVVRTGEVTAGALDGDLILVGKGDITMGGQTGPDGTVVFTDLDHNDANLLPGATIADNNPLAGLDELAEQIKASGVERINGDVIVDDRLWVTQDLGTEDGPVSPIIINNNLIDVVTTPGVEGEPASVTMRPEVAPWRVVNRVQTVAAGEQGAIEITSPRYGVIVLRGTIAADSDPVLKVEHFDDPARFARTAFIEALERAGVQVPGDATAANPAQDLPSDKRVAKLPEAAALEGLSLEENGTYILKVSYNRGAQTQICLLAAAIGSRDCDDGFPEMATILEAAGVDPAGASLVDGSGLPGNFITASTITDLMESFAARPDAQRWQEAQPIMGVDGSVATVQKDSPAAGNVYAKTGTLGAQDLLNQRLRLETKALGGYVIAESGRKLAIAIIVNQAMFNDIQGVFDANEDLGKIATTIYEQN